MNPKREHAEPNSAQDGKSLAPSSQHHFEPLPTDAIAAPCRVTVAAPVVQAVRRHARAHPQTEVCGVLIGEDLPEGTLIEAAIPGENALQGGAHVTFTQETWEHIYAVKDRDYPEKRIVGWYHSHPGFGVFLSRQDVFIHENFFSAPFQVAWVFDPQSDEEGCFGWVDGNLQRLGALRIVDPRHGQLDALVDEPAATEADIPADEPNEGVPASRKPAKETWRKRIVLLFSLALVFVAGLAAGLLLLPRTLVMYSLPDGRLLSESEMRAAVERARALQQIQRQNTDGQQAEPAPANPAPASSPADQNSPGASK